MATMNKPPLSKDHVQRVIDEKIAAIVEMEIAHEGNIKKKEKKKKKNEKDS